MYTGSCPELGGLASLSFSWTFLYGFDFVVTASDITLEFKAGIRGDGVWVTLIGSPPLIVDVNPFKGYP